MTLSARPGRSVALLGLPPALTRALVQGVHLMPNLSHCSLCQLQKTDTQEGVSLAHRESFYTPKHAFFCIIG